MFLDSIILSLIHMSQHMKYIYSFRHLKYSVPLFSWLKYCFSRVPIYTKFHYATTLKNICFAFCVFCMHVWSSELKLHMAVCYHVGAGNQAHVLCKSSKCSYCWADSLGLSLLFRIFPFNILFIFTHFKTIKKETMRLTASKEGYMGGIEGKKMEI